MDTTVFVMNMLGKVEVHKPKFDAFQFAVWFDEDNIPVPQKADFRNENKSLNKLSEGMPVTKWYFNNIKAASAALDICIKKLEAGDTMLLKNFVQFKILLAYLDNRAEFQGMRFDGDFKTSAELLKPQLDKVYWLISKRLQTRKVTLVRVASIRKEERVSIST